VAEGYDALSVILVALNKCEVKNTDCVKQILLNDRLDYLGVSGFNGFDENGDVILPFYIRTVKNGEAVRVN
jgi:ABC-type branched-subunit amino acid transport system substrate-binding protein